MVETAGTKLRRARQQRQLSIEDVSRATKIRPHQITDLEGDEYSNFANLAYAKSYLIAYGKYLQIDTRPYMEAFADANTFGMDDYQYLSDTPVGVFRSTRRMPRSPRIRRKQWMAALTTTGVLTVLLFCRLLYNTYERLGGDFDKLAERRAAHERAGHEVRSMASAPEVVPAAAAPVAPANDAPDARPVASTPSAPDEMPVADNARLAAARAVSRPAPVELPALAPRTADPAPAPAAVPVVPIPGDSGGVREALAAPANQRPALDPAETANRPPAGYRSPMFRPDDAQPQTVVNDHLVRPVN